MLQTSSIAPFDLLFFSLEDWDEIWRRNQFVCASWSRRHPQQKILFVTPPRVVPIALKKRDFSILRGKSQNPTGLSNIHIFRPLRLFPNTFAPLRAFNDWHERRQINAEMRRLRVKAPLMWLNSHFALHAVEKIDKRSLIYDITDDWISLRQTDARRQLVVDLDAQLCRLADCTIVCSQHLLELKKSLARRLELVPNGVDCEHYARVNDDVLPANPLARGWKRPVLGYTGTIHPDRIDLDLVAALCKAVPDATVALVGPDMLSPAQRAPLQRFPNLVLTGAVPYSQIPDVMRTFNVCITPHLETDFTQSLNPIKLWEYLAAGKPIVATDVAGFRDFKPLVLIASGAADFVAACRVALNGDDLATQRQEIALHNSWDARLDQIESILAEVTR